MESTNDTINQLRAQDGFRPNPTVAEPVVAPVAAEPVAQPTPTPIPEPVAAAPVAPPPVPVDTPPVPPVVQSAEAPEIAELRNKVAEYEAKMNLSPFANDLVKKVNQIIASGGSLNEVQRFIDIQSIDLSSLDDEKSIKTAWRLENPAFSNEEIDALYQDKFGADEDDSNAVLLASARRKSEALVAKAKLAEQKVNSVPEHVRQAELNANRFEQAVLSWTPQVAQLGNTVDLTVNDEGLEVPFQYSVPQELLGSIRQEATKWAAANNIPLTQEGQKQVSKFMELAAYAQKSAEINKALVRNAYEAGVKATKAAEAGAPVGSPQFQPPADAYQDTIEKMKQADRATQTY